MTEEGKAAYARHIDPVEFMREAVRGYQAWKKAQPDEDDQPGDVEPADIEGASAAVTLERAQEDAWSEIERYLRAMPPYQFQELVASLLRAMGYHVAWVAPPGKDGGTDIVAYNDPLGAQGPRIKVQVKRHNTGRVGVGDLRSFLAVLGTQDIGIFVATNGFSPDAHAEARAQDNRRLTLIDLESLFDLWVQHYDAVPELERRALPLQQVHFLAPLT